MEYSEIHKKLKDAGCFIIRNGANHPVWKSPKTGKTFPTSYHEAKEAKKGTIREISRLSGVTL